MASARARLSLSNAQLRVIRRLIFLCAAFVTPFLASLILDYKPALAACGQAGGGLCFNNVVPYFSIDSAAGAISLTASYIQVNLTNTTASTIKDISVTLQCCTATGGSFVLNDTPIRYIAQLAPSEVGRLYYYITQANTLPNVQAFTYSYTAYYNGTSETSANYTTTQLSLIAAGSGGQPKGVDIATSYLGQQVYLTVTYASGNLASGDMTFMPAVNQDFNGKCYQLTSVSVYTTSGFTAGGVVPGAQELFYPQTVNGTATSWSVVYGFRVRCLSGTTLLPFTYAMIGGKYKYLMGAPSTAATPGQPFIAMQKYPESSAKISTGGMVTWSVLITNGSPVTVELRRITDTLPAGAAFVTTTSASMISQENSFLSPRTGDSGKLTWLGIFGVSYVFAPNSATRLQYVTTITGAEGFYTNTVSAGAGEVEVLSSTARIQVGTPTAVTLDRMDAATLGPPAGGAPPGGVPLLALLGLAGLTSALLLSRVHTRR